MEVPSDFEEFARAEGKSLLAYAYLLTHDLHAAEDLVQDAFLRLHKRWERRAPDHPIAYARRTIMNEFLRTAGRTKVVPQPVRERAPMDERLAEHDRVWRLLGTLPAKQRAALVLRYYEDLPDPEIARVLGCRRSTVRSLVARGLGAMRTNEGAKHRLAVGDES